MGIRTDLALESAEQSGQSLPGQRLPSGVEQDTLDIGGVTVTKVRIVSQEGSDALSKPQGEYATIEADSLKHSTGNFEGEIDALAQTLSSMLPQGGKVLVAGLGNSDITPDALGPKAAAKTLATRHIGSELAKQAGLEGLRDVAVIATGVLGQTGMESAEIVASIAAAIKPDAVVVIDALACAGIDRLGSTIQITDTGISPGSGVQNKRKELSRQSLGVPVIAIGVPTVVDMTTIACDITGGDAGNLPEKIAKAGQTMMVTPREIDVIIDRAAKLVAMGLNKALQPTLSLEELEGLVG